MIFPNMIIFLKPYVCGTDGLLIRSKECDLLRLKEFPAVVSEQNFEKMSINIKAAKSYITDSISIT